MQIIELRKNICIKWGHVFRRSHHLSMSHI